MTFDWRVETQANIEAHFNPRVAVPEALELMAEMIARSRQVRDRLGGQYDLHYGEGEKQTFDLFPAANDSFGNPPPAQIFIHGGYWRAFDKGDHSVCAEAIVNRGISHISLNYDLCPDVSLSRIVEQIYAAIHYIHSHAGELGIDADRLYLCGHSAGAHLAAMMLSQAWPNGCPIEGIVAISGIYEPEPVLQVSINHEIGLDVDNARANDVLKSKLIETPPVVVAVGGDEPEGWRQQSHAFADHCQAAGIDCQMVEVPGRNHFTVVDSFSTAGEPLFEQIVAQISASG